MINEPFHILLAEDDESDRLFFKEAMEEMTLNPIVNTVNNGVELMSFLSKKDVVLPHLIFLDLNMPRKNGMECLKEIRSDDKLKDISIAIYSTSDNEKDIEETFLMGANVYITKPNDINSLKLLLNKAVTTTQIYHDKTFNRENYYLRVY